MPSPHAPSSQTRFACTWFQAQISPIITMHCLQPQLGSNDNSWAKADSTKKGMAGGMGLALLAAPQYAWPATGIRACQGQGWTSTSSTHPSQTFQAIFKHSHFNFLCEHCTEPNFTSLSLHLQMLPSIIYTLS